MNNPPYPDNANGPCTVNFMTFNPVPLGTAWNQAFWAPDVARSITGNIELKGKFTTGMFEHSGLVGIDHLDFNDVDNAINSFVPTSYQHIRSGLRQRRPESAAPSTRSPAMALPPSLRISMQTLLR